MLRLRLPRSTTHTVGKNAPTRLSTLFLALAPLSAFAPSLAWSDGEDQTQRAASLQGREGRDLALAVLMRCSLGR
ncbi:MAG: hypothetical protein NTZ05_18790 [Chloroflexi bacterium]|nr:hypothetical protein [Chloroflexota bacterium]